jgi:hypothetical protein
MTARVLCVLIWVHASGRVSPNASTSVHDSDQLTPTCGLDKAWVSLPYFYSPLAIKPTSFRLFDAYSIDYAWLQCGLLAATSLTVLSVVSLRPIRERNYELFLLIHFVLAL